jgi:hypothetical protein
MDTLVGDIRNNKNNITNINNNDVLTFFLLHFSKHYVLCVLFPILKAIMREGEREYNFLCFTRSKSGDSQKLMFSQGHPLSEGWTWAPSSDRSASEASSLSSFLHLVSNHTNNCIMTERDKL